MKIDFKNPECVRSLSKCCLHKDFNLDIELPPLKLLPTIPLRLNYLLWIEDLLQHARISEPIVGVDIGCGASCIYCLLAVRMNVNWKMFALEIDSNNIKFAQDNIDRNHLGDNIKVITQDDSSKLFSKLFQENSQQKSFCLCNPPFFSSPIEVTNAVNRTGKRKRPRSQNAGTSSELVYEDGGELGFAQKILEESLELRNKIQIYSTMFGCKKNLLNFMDELRKQKIDNCTTTVFSQGKTSRWGVAWSFHHEIKSFKDPTASSEKVSHPTHILKHTISGSDFLATTNMIRRIFEELDIKVKIIEEKLGQSHRWEIVATRDTWSNQRRRRRAEQTALILNETASSVEQDLHVAVEIFNNTESTLLQMFFLCGSMNKDCANQIMQFLKNKFKCSQLS